MVDEKPFKHRLNQFCHLPFQIDGTCTCATGWSGPLCDTACPSGSWGLNCANQCLNCSQGSCDSVTGACTCFDGFTGPGCTQPCSTGWWGAGCHQQCSCMNGVCDITDGTCTCNPGYKGVDCSTACDVSVVPLSLAVACPVLYGAKDWQTETHTDRDTNRQAD